MPFREREANRDLDRDRNSPRREFRRRDEDLGPSVVGFGDDVPSFMLITTAKRRAAPEPDVSENEIPDILAGEAEETEA